MSAVERGVSVLKPTLPPLKIVILAAASVKNCNG